MTRRTKKTRPPGNLRWKGKKHVSHHERARPPMKQSVLVHSHAIDLEDSISPSHS